MPAAPTSDPAPTVLHAEVFGNGSPLVMAHGFTQTGRVWGSMDTRLAAAHHVIRVDMPGHGGSAHVAAGVADGALLLGATGGTAAYLGYSMGARFCLHLALARPELVSHLVLISGTAGIEDPAERAARRSHDEALADQLEAPHSLHPTDDPSDPGQARLDTFLRQWLDNPLFAGIPEAANGFAERRKNTGSGLASSLRLAGTGTQPPQWEQLHRLAMPVLILTGEHDEKFTNLGIRMAAAIGDNATHLVMTGTGHSPHLQQPQLVAEAVIAHLRTPHIL